MALSLGATTPTALYLGTTAISAAYLGATQVYTTGGGDAYAIGGASPELVAAFTTQSDGTTAGEYYRKASSETTFSELFTHSVSGLLTMFDSAGTLCWNPHNMIGGTTLVTAGYPTSGWYVPSPQTYGVTDFLGGTTAMTITDNYAQIVPTGTPVNGAKYRMSFVAKLGTQPHGVTAQCRLKNSGAAMYIAFNFTTGLTQNVHADYDDSGVVDLGGGWWYCWADVIATSSGSFFMLLRADDFQNATWDGSATFCHPSIRRIDIPMADNPDIPTLPWFVPNTTGAAKYLPRRQAYRYNSGWELAGMQMEAAAATNLETYSNDIENQWAQGRCVATNGNLALPVQSGGLASIVDDNSGGTTNTLFVGSNNYTVATSTRYVFSFFAKKGTIDWLAIRPLNFTVAEDFTFVDLTNGVVGTTGTGHTGGIHEVAPDVFLCWVSFVTDASDTVGLFRVYAAAGDNDRVVPNDGTSTLSIGHFQFETGSVPTSRIPTSGSTVTRAAETLSIAGADTPANTTAMSISMKGLFTYPALNANPMIELFRWRASFSNRIESWLFRNGASQSGAILWNHVGTPDAYTELITANRSIFSPGINLPFSIASRYLPGEFNGAVNGNAETAKPRTVIPDLSATPVQLGVLYNGFISEFRMWGADIGDSGIAEVTA